MEGETFARGRERRGPLLLDCLGTGKTLLVALGLCILVLLTGWRAPDALEISTSSEFPVCEAASGPDQEGIREACTNPIIDLHIARMRPQHQYVEVSLALVRPREFVGERASSQRLLNLAVWGISDDGDEPREHEAGNTTDKVDAALVPIVVNASRVQAAGCSDHSTKSKLLLYSERPALCTPSQILSLNLVQYPAYRIIITFEDEWVTDYVDTVANYSQVSAVLFMEYTSTAFTRFEIIFKYTLLSLGALVCGVYLARLRGAGFISFEQRWVAGLCVGLLFFNDPLCALDVFVQNLVFPCLRAVTTVSFLAALLLFWLLTPLQARSNAEDARAALGDAWRASSAKVVHSSSLTQPNKSAPASDDGSARSIDNEGAEEVVAPLTSNTLTTVVRRHLCKVLLCFAIWAAVCSVQIFVAVAQYRDPTFDPSQDLRHEWILRPVIVCVSISYLGCFVAAVAREALLFRFIRPSDRLLLAANSGLLLLLAGHVGFATSETAVSTHGLQGRSMVLLHGFLSAYVWVLALAYCPLRSASLLSPSSSEPASGSGPNPCSRCPFGRFSSSRAEQSSNFTRVRSSATSVVGNDDDNDDDDDDDDDDGEAYHAVECREQVAIELNAPQSDGSAPWAMRRSHQV